MRGGLGRLGRLNPPGPLVLMYHGIGERAAAVDPYNLFVPAERFRAQLRWLLSRCYRPLDLQGFLAWRGGPRSVLVTFDDGYASVLTEAYPVLAELGFPAAVFVLAGLLGGRSQWMAEMPAEPLLDADGVRRLASSGIDVGLHGMDHTTMAGLDAAGLRRQTVVAGDLLEAASGVRPAAFAYPGGHHDAAARAAVAAAGFSAAFATYDGAGRFAIPRVDVNALDTARSFRLKTLAAYPSVRRALGRLPAARAGLHSLVGRAGRPRG